MVYGRHGFWARGCRPAGAGFGRRAAMFGAASRFFGPGEVRLALLSLLQDGPRHGYELMKMLEERSGGIYRASAGTIYPTLQQLEDEGLLSAEAQEGKRVYRITEDGRRELAREEETVGRIWRRARMWKEWRGAFDPDAQEIVRPAERVMKAALHAMSESANPSRADKIREILERALKDIEGLDKRS
jgi:DNA-binding PadR family transcriptional regulator